jgi:hypothetical protein
MPVVPDPRRTGTITSGLSSPPELGPFRWGKGSRSRGGYLAGHREISRGKEALWNLELHSGVKSRNVLGHRPVESVLLKWRNLMTKLKLLVAAAAVSTVVVAPAMAQDVYYRDGHRYYHDRGPVGAAADVAGAAIGTAGAIATAPFRNSYAYDRDMGPSGFACRPGTWFKGADGRRHLCQ